MLRNDTLVLTNHRHSGQSTCDVNQKRHHAMRTFHFHTVRWIDVKGSDGSAKFSTLPTIHQSWRVRSSLATILFLDDYLLSYVSILSRCKSGADYFSEWINLESSSNIAPPDTNDRASGYEIFVESSLFKVSFVASNGFLAVSQGNAIPSTLASFDGDHYQTAIQTIFLFLSWRW